jgi:hypothetical protein
MIDTLLGGSRSTGIHPRAPQSPALYGLLAGLIALLIAIVLPTRAAKITTGLKLPW